MAYVKINTKICNELIEQEIFPKLHELANKCKIPYAVLEFSEGYKYIVSHYQKLTYSINIDYCSQSYNEKNLYEFIKSCNIIFAEIGENVNMKAFRYQIGELFRLVTPINSIKDNGKFIDLNPIPNKWLLFVTLLEDDYDISQELALLYLNNKELAEKITIKIVIIGIPLLIYNEDFKKKWASCFEYGGVDDSIQISDPRNVIQDRVIFLIGDKGFIKATDILQVGRISTQFKNLFESIGLMRKTKKRKPTQEIINQIETFCQSRTSVLIDSCARLLANIDTITTYDLVSGKIHAKKPIFECDLMYLPEKKSLVTNIMNELSYLIKNKTHLKLNIYKSNLSIISPGNKCSKCNLNLDGISHFKCGLCANFSLCLSCGKYNVPIKTPSEIPHFHDLFLIPVNPKNCLKHINVGPHLYSRQCELIQPICEVCGQNYEKTRCICLKCKMKFCIKCFLNTKDNNEETITKMLDRNHDPKKHIIDIVEY